MSEARGWYSRGYLPHLDGAELTQSVTFRLYDSLPPNLIAMWQDELASLSPIEAKDELVTRVEKYLDQGYGACYMKDEQIAHLVQSALLYFDGQRYALHDRVVMPNHVHAVFTPFAEFRLGKILHSWKSFSATRANRILDRTGDFWFPDFFDRYVRDEEHFGNLREYIALNPVKAGLCAHPHEYPWSSYHTRHK